MYTVQGLAQLSGLTPRTLRHYDAIGLLVPQRAVSSGYRMYAQKDVDRLQQILFYRELEFPLEEILELLNAPGFQPLKALQSHKSQLLQKRAKMDALLLQVDETIMHIKGENKMSNTQKFKAFKQKLVADNEERYGVEIREKYGDETVDTSNAKMMKMSDEQYKRFESLEQELTETLKKAIATGDAGSALAQKAAALHQDWLAFHWPKYSPEAHNGLAQMYVDDERFAAYYEKIAAGAAVFLRDAIVIYTKDK